MAKHILTDVQIDGDLAVADVIADNVSTMLDINAGQNVIVVGDLTVQGIDLLEAIADAELLAWMGL